MKSLINSKESIVVTANKGYCFIAVVWIGIYICLGVSGIKTMGERSWSIIDLIGIVVLYAGGILMCSGCAYWIINLGRKIELTKAGCNISLLFLKREYSWSEYEIKQLEKYYNGYNYGIRPPYEEGAVFSKYRVKRTKKYRPEDMKFLWNKSAFSTVWVTFGNEKCKRGIYMTPIYEVNKEEFLQKMEEWEVELKKPE